jgi:hypothetical protein
MAQRHAKTVFIYTATAHNIIIFTWFKRYNILVRICVHFLGFTGVSLKVRVSCSTVVFSIFWKGFPLPENKFKPIYVTGNNIN